LAARGASVIVNYFKNKEAADKVVEEILHDVLNELYYSKGKKKGTHNNSYGLQQNQSLPICVF
jgi:hypothetical protein